MKKGILLLVVAAMALGVFADAVSSDMAIAAANAWSAKNGAFGAGTWATGDVLTERDANGVVLWHQVSMTGGGMLVVAPVTELEPIIVALDNDPGSLPAAHPLRGILTGDLTRRLKFLGLYPEVSSGPSLQSVTPASAGVSEEAQAWGESGKAKWARLGIGTGVSLQEAESVGVTEIAIDVCTVKGFEKGGALTHWNQGSYNGSYLYNLYTPHHAVCGCVATACSALAQFYGTTNAVGGIVGKNCTYNGNPYSATFGSNAKTIGGPIDWNILPKKFGGTNETETLTTEQQELIGRVAFDAGVGLNMMWTDEESGAFTSDIADVLKNVFGFRNARWVGMSDEENPSQEELEKLIYNQCRAGVPVGMSIDGHAVVAVGYGLDADNIERVRVFMGWAGSGDGWYALPKIDTKATMNGGTYLSEIVSGVITMISYADDEIVPVVGHVSMPGVSLSIPALGKTFAANDYGYFGTRVAVEASPVTVSCMAKEAVIDIGADAAEEEDSAKLCEALPAAFEFALLNATVAYSLERAQFYAEREGKAILRVSGTSTESNTIAVLNYIYDLDDQNINDFTNRFVYLFSSRSSTEGDGAEVSYGVYNPLALEPDQRWLASNGALAYGYMTTLAWETNYTHSAGHAGETNEVADVTTSTFVYTFAPIDAEAVTVTNAVDAVDAITNALLASVAQVMQVGWTDYAKATSGISITIGTTNELATAAINESAAPEFACGLHEGCYVDGEVVELVCNAVVTNSEAGIVFGCAGWSLTNLTTGATQTGTGGTASFTVAKGDEIEFTWDLSRKVAVYVTVTWSDPEVLNDPEAVTPLSGWYSYGEPVIFTAKEKIGTYGFNKWQGGLNGQKLSDTCYKLGPTTLCVTMEEPCDIYAYFRKGVTVAPVTTETVKVTASSWFLTGGLEFVEMAADAAPTSTVYSASGLVALPSGATNEVPAANVVLDMKETSYRDADGQSWVLLGYSTDEDLTDPEATYMEAHLAKFTSVSQDVEVKWLWIPDTQLGPVSFAIDWDDALSTLNAHGYSTNLITKAELERRGISIENVTVTAPKGFKAKLAFDASDNLVATLSLDEEVLQPVAADGVSSPLTILANGDGTVTVKADVANGVKGFWYSLYGADELTGPWNLVASGEYEAGEPTAQAKADDTTVSVSIDIQPSDAKKFFKLVVTDTKPSPAS